MKTPTFLLVILIVCSLNLNAQIPNNGFEDWSVYRGGMTPDGWWCSNNGMDPGNTYFPVTRSIDHYPYTEGEYSMRIESNPALTEWAAYGIAWPGGYTGSDFPTFPVTGHPKRLCGYYKFFPQNGDRLNIQWFLYKDGQIVPGGYGIFLSGEVMENWTPFEIAVYDTLYAEADSARISVSSFYNPLQGNTVLYIDNLSFDELLTANQNVVAGQRVKLYPNPADDRITLDYGEINHPDLTISIFNTMGMLVKEESNVRNRQVISVSDLKAGVYVVNISSGDWAGKEKLVIRR